MKPVVYALLMAFLIILTACNQNSSPTINPEVLVTATPPELPDSGMASAYGQVAHNDGYPLVDTIVRLAEVARGAEGRGGAYILSVANSPGTRTDANGYFTFLNIKAGEYVIVVGDVDATGIYEIITESNGQARVWNLPANQVTNVGVLTVKIVPPTPNPTYPPEAYPLPTRLPYP